MALPSSSKISTVLLNVWRALQVVSFIGVQNMLKEPYMDEVFHVPQAQKYCRGHFSNYDDKLTTPPGLYLVSLCLHRAGLSCGIGYLRLLNLFIGIVLLPNLFSNIHRQLYPRAASVEHDWARCLAAMPILSFFSLLYYTDLGSTYLVFLSYYMTLQNKRWLAVMCGFLSLWFRQTNLLWIIAFAALQLFQHLKTIDLLPRQDEALETAALKSTAQLLLKFVHISFAHWPISLKVLRPYVTIIIFSLIFIVYNGSIVLGDKTMHQAGFYPIQWFYFSSCCILLSATPCCSENSLKAVRHLLKRPAFIIFILLAALACASQKSTQHPFLLSDNRHFTFYINKRLIQKLSAPSLAIAFAAFTILLYQRVRHVSVVTILAFSIATFVTLSPTSLLEFRYYLIPFLLWRLHSGYSNLARGLLILELCSWITIHAIIVYLFLYKPFNWPNSLEKQRFMW